MWQAPFVKNDKLEKEEDALEVKVGRIHED